jgi:hypothetical protein
MEEIAALSDRMIVMSRHSAEILQKVFHVPSDQIDTAEIQKVGGLPDCPSR